MNRRLVALGAVMATAALVFLAAALGVSAGSGVRVSRVATGAAPIAGSPWTLKLRVRPASFSGVVRVVATGPGRLAVRARGGRGVYRARLVFPQPGAWRLTALAGGYRSSLGSIRVRPAPPLLFDEPTGIDVRPDGSLLVVEFGLRRLVQVDPATGRTTELATFDKPWGVAQSRSGSVFVSDRGSLIRIDGDRARTTIATADPGVEIGPVAVAAGGDVFYSTARALYRVGSPQPLAADLNSPHGLALARDGAVFVSDTENGRILRVEPVSGQVTTFATLGHPRGIDVADDGTVYVVAADEHRVVRYSADGGRLGPVGPRFNDPYALALAPGRTAYAIEAGPQGFIRRIDHAGRSSIVGSG
jgi:streptogramin lyase